VWGPADARGSRCGTAVRARHTRPSEGRERRGYTRAMGYCVAAVISAALCGGIAGAGAVAWALTPAPAYTVAQVQAGLAQRPQAWGGANRAGGRGDRGVGLYCVPVVAVSPSHLVLSSAGRGTAREHRAAAVVAPSGDGTGAGRDVSPVASRRAVHARPSPRLTDAISPHGRTRRRAARPCVRPPAPWGEPRAAGPGDPPAHTTRPPPGRSWMHRTGGGPVPRWSRPVPLAPCRAARTSPCR